jgi:uncharacterized cupredoxin-like copper-binding protein
VVGCGGSDDDEDSSSNAATPAATTGGGGGAGGAVDLTATDFKFDPSEPTVKSGEVSFTLKNDGQTEHSLEIEDVNGEDVEIEGDVSPGSSGTLKANLALGSYEFYCPVGNHKEMGMTGEITVK